MKRVELGMMPWGIGPLGGLGVAGEDQGRRALPADLSPRAFVSMGSADLAIFMLTLALTGSPQDRKGDWGGGGLSWEEHFGNDRGARARLVWPAGCCLSAVLFTVLFFRIDRIWDVMKYFTASELLFTRNL